MIPWLVVFALQVQPAAPPTPAEPAAQPLVVVSYVPERVYDSRHKRFTDFEAMLAEIARADVALVGEQHDDRNTHRLELALLEGLMRRRMPLTLSLEMFERDAQKALADYEAGAISEDDFLKQSRPWPRYATDYRPMVEFASAHKWNIVAANVPRRIAAEVSKAGMGSLDTLTPEERAWVADRFDCPKDKYRDRFVSEMKQHPMPGAEKMPATEVEAMYDRFYLAQCLKDETMAESIAKARGAGDALVVHYTGAFHTDFGQGTAERVRRRLKNAKVVTLTMLPVDNIDTVSPSKEDRKRADYIVYTTKPMQSPHSRAGSGQ
jgi:uncharacterized iron-regulated protein